VQIPGLSVIVMNACVIEITQIKPLRQPHGKRRLRLLKQILLPALIAWLISPLSFAQTKSSRANQTKGRTAQTTGAEAELKKLEREWFDAVVKGDVETLNRIFADDFTAINSDGSFVNKAEMNEMMKSSRIKLDEIRTGEFGLRLYGNTAIVTGRATYLRDRKPLGQSSHTEVWVKRAGPSGKPRWQAVSWVSIPIKSSVLGAKAVTTQSGLRYEDIVVGTGASPQPGQEVTVHYTGTFEDGTKFDSSLDHGQPFKFKIGAGLVIKGWDEGVMTMKVGGKRKLVIPPHLGYGSQGAGNVIPPNATLVFEVELLGVQ
jgi:peptidylprolyl isomerase